MKNLIRCFYGGGERNTLYRNVWPARTTIMSVVLSMIFAEVFLRSFGVKATTVRKLIE